MKVTNTRNGFNKTEECTSFKISQRASHELIVRHNKHLRGFTLRTTHVICKRIKHKKWLQHLVPLEVRAENELADKPSDNDNDGNLINVNIDRKLQKSGRVNGKNANLIRKLNKEDRVLIL